MIRMIFRNHFMLSLLVALMLSSLSSCRIDEGSRIDVGDLSYDTTDDSEMFFKNVRQLYYNKEELRNGGLTTFRLRKRNRDPEAPVINLAIVMHWRDDKAYILQEPSDYFSEMDPIPVILQATDSLPADTLNIRLETKQEMLIESAVIFEGIRQSRQFLVIRNGDVVPFLSNPQDRETFRVTMSDYLRLTRNFK